MKKLLLLSVFISYSVSTYCQVPSWQIDENYMYTSFFDDFNDPCWRTFAMCAEK
jgi:hypothetical protein